MIHSLKSANRINVDFIVADIENRSDGTVIAIDTYNGEDHVHHFDWGNWLNWIILRSTNDRRYRTVYAHNGGGWDWLSFIEYVLLNNPNLKFHTIENGNRIIAIILPLPEHNLTIRLCDSIFMFGNPPRSLDQVSLKFTGKGKVKTGELMPEDLWNTDQAKFWDYLHGDTECLYNSMAALCRIIYTHIAPIPKLGLTLPSTALKCFQTKYLPREVTTPGDDRLKAMLRLGYSGGRVEVFEPGHYPKINVYDFNSLYPAVMRTTNVPDTGTAKRVRDFLPDICSVYHVRFNQRNRALRPILMVNGVGAYDGEGVYFSNELDRFVRLAGGKIEIVEGYAFRSQSILFKDYVDTLYSLRMTDKDSAIGDTCKLMLNSLYGKFGQRQDRTKTIHCDGQTIVDMIKNGGKVETLNAEKGIYRVVESRETNFEHVGIAGTITSEARARLWEQFDSGTVYCDTDSIHTTKTKPHNNTELGALKLEFSGEGVYVGKKLYALKNGKKEKLRVKGVRVGGKNGFDLTFAGLKTLLDGSKIRCEFKSATTANSVLRSKKTACVFAPKHRTIRATHNAKHRNTKR